MPCRNCTQSERGSCPVSQVFPGHHLARQRTQVFAAETNIYSAGEIPDTIGILKSGWAYKFVPLDHGQRQILCFYIAGDIIDQDAVILPNTPLPFPTRTLTASEVCFFDAQEYRDLRSQDVRSRRFVKQHLQHSQQLLAKHLVDVARRRAPNRISSLVLELDQRLGERGLASESMPFPFRQQDLADALGMTIAHVNRTLKSLRDVFTIDIERHVLHVRNPAALNALAHADTHIG